MKNNDKVQVVNKSANREKSKFQAYTDKNSVMRICNVKQFLTDIEYTNIHDAILDADKLLAEGQSIIWVVVVPQGQTEIDLVKYTPYWVLRLRSKKLNADGTLCTEQPTVKAVSPSKKALLDRIAELEAKLNQK